MPPLIQITLPASPVTARLIGRTQTSTASAATISQQAMLLGNRPASCNQAQMYLRTQMVETFSSLISSCIHAALLCCHFECMSNFLWLIFNQLLPELPCCFYPCQLILTPAATVAAIQSDLPTVTSCSSLPTSSQVQSCHSAAQLCASGCYRTYSGPIMLISGSMLLSLDSLAVALLTAHSFKVTFF